MTIANLQSPEKLPSSCDGEEEEDSLGKGA